MSIVVPVHDVEDYLPECLASLQRQTFSDLEVVLVVDSSTDRSEQIARDTAGAHPQWQVLEADSGSPGGARNIGIAAATGEYLMFVDADDVVPADGVERLVAVLDETGSDLACGSAKRYDGMHTWASPIQSRSIKQTVLRTHITRTPSLLRETVVWAKLFRRSFWDRAGLRFPEGVLFEDMPVATLAQFRAHSVDLIDTPVYWWRLRQSDAQSITQRRRDPSSLADRMLALSTINEFLVEHDPGGFKDLHDRKVLTVDIPIHMQELPDADEAFQQLFLDLVGAYLATVSPKVLGQLAPRLRLPYYLVARRMLPELVEVMTVARDPARNDAFVRRGLRLYADLPFFGDERVGVPREVYDVTRTQPLWTGVRDLRWDSGALVIDGHAYIDRAPMPVPGGALQRVFARPVGGAASGRVGARVRPVRRADLTARMWAEPISYDWAGFSARLPVEALLRASGGRDAEWEVIVQVATPWARRGGRLGKPRHGSAMHPPHALVGDTVVAPGYADGDWLRLRVWQPPVVVDELAFEAGLAHFSGRVTPTGPARLELGLFRRDSLHAVPLEVRQDGVRFTASVPLAEVGVRDDLVSEADWDLRVLADDGSPAAPCAADPAIRAQRWGHAWRELFADVSDRGALVLRDRISAPVLRDAMPSPRGLMLSGTSGAPLPLVGLRLEHTDGSRVQVPVEQSRDAGTDGEWTALVPATGEPGTAALRNLHSGTWSLVPVLDDIVAGEPASGDAPEQLPVFVGRRLAEQLRGEFEVAGRTFTVQADRDDALALGVDAAGEYADRGAYRRRVNRLRYKAYRRVLPTRDIVLFENWRGKQYSDSPQAIYEELRARRPDLRLVWGFTDLSVEVPDDVDRVLRFGREYNQLLAQARWVVSNDSMATWYHKRPGTTYLQTWHGTPLKRLAFDVPELKIANKDYLRQFGREVAKWDYLISPNPFSSEIFPRAFHYGGPLLETGYPRNDVFYRPDEVAARQAATRRRLGLPDGVKVLLYAPTWRDHRFDVRGNYQFDMRLNLEQMRRELAGEWVVLVRGHHILSDQVRIGEGGEFVRNVTRYPDINDLYLIADVAVTDYSSVMFDFANTGRPMLFYTWDLESYRDELRGFYFDFEAEAPGPLLRTTEAVIEAAQDLDGVQKRYADSYAAFRQRFCGLEDGHAAARVVDAVWGR